MKNGWLRLRLRHRLGTDVHLHWSAGVLLALGVPAMLSGQVGGGLAYLLLILVHELGHAAMARFFGRYVVRVEVHAFGGRCLNEGGDDELATIAIAWGGVLAQLVLFVVALCLRDLGAGSFAPKFLSVLLGWNLLIVAFNLLPIGPLDGAVAWRIVPYAWRRLMARVGHSARPGRTSRPGHTARTSPPSKSVRARLRVVRNTGEGATILKFPSRESAVVDDDVGSADQR